MNLDKHLKIYRREQRRKHFNRGGCPEQWRGTKSTTTRDKKKEASKRACRGNMIDFIDFYRSEYLYEIEKPLTDEEKRESEAIIQAVLKYAEAKEIESWLNSIQN